MYRAMKTAPLFILCTLIVAVPSAWADWTPDGAAICTAAGYRNYPQIIPDGTGGAIIAWSDSRGGANDIYAQRVNASGVALWAVNGVAICAAAGYQEYPRIISDGAGGAIITWQDYRGAHYDIYAQRINASGVAQWTANGVALCTAVGPQYVPRIVSDGSGGAIVVWNDVRSLGPYDIYAQRVNAAGAVQWTTNGVALCTAVYDQGNPQITSDGAGGAIVAWGDGRSGTNNDIYAQRVNGSGVPQWAANGVAVSAGKVNNHRIASDGAGGAIVVWEYTYSNFDPDIVAQRVNASGAVQWGAQGVAVIYAGNYYAQASPEIVADGAGGWIVAAQILSDESGMEYGYNIYAQRLNASGARQWDYAGVGISRAGGTQCILQMIPDGAGGAVVTYQDFGTRSGTCIIGAQRVNASGAVRWTENGIALSTEIGTQSAPEIASDGSNGAIITWADGRNGNSGIYAQKVDGGGHVGMLAPSISSVSDVPGDQGGSVRLAIARSGLDAALEPTYPASRYDIWQRIDDPGLLALISGGSGAGASAAGAVGFGSNGADINGAATGDAPLGRAADALIVSGWPIKERNGRYFVESRELLGAGSFPPGAWELLGSFAPTQQSEYVYRAGTLADSTASGIPYSVYIVSVHTTTPSVWYLSYPDSGYSVDNLPPEAPGSLLAEQSFVPVGLALSWDMNAANDLSHYAVYRGSSEGFVPSPGNRVATPLEPEWFDGAWRWSSGYFYKISALDVHGNESGFALVRPDDVTGGDTPRAPEASYLDQNFPNPFNPLTRIAFGLSAPGRVSLRIYDAAGRLVRTLADEERKAGRYEKIWDGMDSSGRAVSSGIYFYRLRTGAFEDTRKMILVR